MATAIVVKVEGLKELNNALQKMKKNVERKLLTASLKAGGKLIRDEAKRIAPVESGTVRDAIRMARGRPPPPYEAQVIVSVRPFSAKQIRAFKQAQGLKGVFKRARNVSPDDPFYWWWQEFGTVNMPAANNGKGFLRPAFESKKGAALGKIKLDLTRRIDNEANKLAKLSRVKRPRV
jgi:HK97 gp10 family phage protein